jgi:hypothetical protein
MTNDPSRIHQPRHVLPLDDARDHVRRALAALRATELPRAPDARELGTIHSVLADQLTAIEQLRRRA